MPNTQFPAEHRLVFTTRASVGAARFIFVVVIWPILSIFIAAACFFVMAAVITTLYPEMGQPGGGVTDLLGLVFGLPILLASAIVAAMVCYTTCRYLTVPLNESKPPDDSRSAR